MSDENREREAPAEVRELIDRIDVTWRQFLAALDGIPEERLSEPGVAGDWSLKDLLGHIAFWDEHAIQEMERALAGLPRDDEAWQEMNDADYLARRDLSLAEQRSAMHQAHAALLERLGAIAGLDAARLDEAVRPDTYVHYADHAKDVRAWRERVGV